MQDVIAGYVALRGQTPLKLEVAGGGASQLCLL